MNIRCHNPEHSHCEKLKTLSWLFTHIKDTAATKKCLTKAMHDEGSMSMTPCVKIIKFKVTKMLNVTYLLHWSSIIFQHNHQSFQSWHQFKNSITTKIRLLNSHPFTKNHFHFIKLETSVLPSVASVAQTALQLDCVLVKCWTCLTICQ
jgi:hypothetical protein